MSNTYARKSIYIHEYIYTYIYKYTRTSISVMYYTFCLDNHDLLTDMTDAYLCFNSGLICS